MPPKPSKKAQIIMLIDIFFIGILEIVATPLVSSTIPESMPFAKLLGILKTLSIGDKILDKMSKMPVFFSIEIITLKSITKPPIMTIVLIEVMILFCKILPKELSLGGVFLLPFEKEEKLLCLVP